MISDQTTQTYALMVDCSVTSIVSVTMLDGVSQRYSRLPDLLTHCHIVASELNDPICHSDECQIGSFSSEATICNPHLDSTYYPPSTSETTDVRLTLSHCWANTTKIEISLDQLFLAI